MNPVDETSKRRPSKRAAVLIPVLIEGSEPSLLFTVRSMSLNRHRGQVSFPGGLCDPSDATATDTALREAEEELGLPPNAVDVWGELQSLPDRERLVMITPVLGSLGNFDVKSLKLNKAEVSKVFTLPLQKLLLRENRLYTCFKPRHILLPVFLGGPRRIWGITAFILDLALHRIASHFNRKSQEST